MYLAKEARQDPELIGAVASEYLNVFGFAMFAFSWAHQCAAALEQGDAFAQTKLKTARFFYNNVLPEMEGHKAVVLAGKGPMMTFDDSEF